jgi:hypothetical protein
MQYLAQHRAKVLIQSQGGFKIGARTAVSASFWRPDKIRADKAVRAPFPRFLNPP